MFSKVVTKPGPDQSPVYSYLGGATGQLPQWNFAKYLVGKDGRPIAFYNSKVTPEDKELLAAIDKALAAN
jgi:glutathione peroxidase